MMYRFFLIISSVILVGCVGSQSTLSKKKTTMEVIKLSPFDTRVELAKGQRCSYTCQDHQSVGWTSDFSISDPQILSLIDNTLLFKNPKQKEHPVPGGDAGQRTYVFETKAKGTCQLTIQTYMRGKLDREHVIELTVK